MRPLISSVWNSSSKSCLALAGVDRRQCNHYFCDLLQTVKRYSSPKLVISDQSRGVTCHMQELSRLNVGPRNVVWRFWGPELSSGEFQPTLTTGAMSVAILYIYVNFPSKKWRGFRFGGFPPTLRALYKFTYLLYLQQHFKQWVSGEWIDPFHNLYAHAHNCFRLQKWQAYCKQRYSPTNVSIERLTRPIYIFVNTTNLNNIDFFSFCRSLDT